MAEKLKWETMKWLFALFPAVALAGCSAPEVAVSNTVQVPVTPTPGMVIAPPLPTSTPLPTPTSTPKKPMGATSVSADPDPAPPQDIVGYISSSWDRIESANNLDDASAVRADLARMSLALDKEKNQAGMRQDQHAMWISARMGAVVDTTLGAADAKYQYLDGRLPEVGLNNVLRQRDQAIRAAQNVDARPSGLSGIGNMIEQDGGTVGPGHVSARPR